MDLAEVCMAQAEETLNSLRGGVVYSLGAGGRDGYRKYIRFSEQIPN